MSILKGNLIREAGSIDGVTGARVSGGQSILVQKIGPGLGKYRLVFFDGVQMTEAQIAPSQGACLITPRGPGNNLSYSMEWFDPTFIVVKTFVGGVAADVSFDYTILNLVGV